MKISIKTEIKGKQILEKIVRRTGSGAHILLPKTWIGSRIKVILLEGEKIDLTEMEDNEDSNYVTLYQLREKKKQIELQIKAYQKHRKRSVRERIPNLEKKLKEVEIKILQIENLGIL